MPNRSLYAGRRASLATKHDKLPLIAPSMRDAVGLEVFCAGTDTDRFGTFDGDVPRIDTPFRTAVAKARHGMEESGASIGIASEGSIGQGNMFPLVSDLEIVVLVDDGEGFVLGESAESLETVVHSWTTDADEPDHEDLLRAGFPGHGLIVRPDGGTGPVVKGIHRHDELVDAVRQCRDNGAATVRIESDLRAHHCPSRRPVIETAARRLAERLAVTCASCGCPGWGRVDVLRGLPCAACGNPTEAVMAEIDGCARCGTKATGKVREAQADPSTCGTCNP